MRTPLHTKNARNHSIFCGTLILLIAVLPLSSVRLSIAGSSLSLLTIAGLFFLIAGLLCFRVKDVRDVYREYRTICFLVVCFIISIFTAVISTGNTHGWGIFFEWFLIPLLSGFVLSLGFRTYGSEVGKAFSTGVLIALLGILLSSCIFLYFDITTWDDRFFGLLPSPNHFALFVSPLIAFAFVQAWLERSSFKKTSLLLTAVGLTPFLYMSGSFGGVVALCGSLILSLGILMAAHLPRRKILIIVCSTITLAVILTPFALHKFHSAYSDLERSPLASRIMIWRSGIDLIRESPLVGIGVGNFQGQYLEAQKYYKPYLEWAVPLPHNTFLAMWLYGGFLTLLFFSLIITYTLYSVATKKEQPHTWLPFFAGLTAILIHSVVDTAYFRPDLALIFWFLVFVLLRVRINH